MITTHCHHRSHYRRHYHPLTSFSSLSSVSPLLWLPPIVIISIFVITDISPSRQTLYSTRWNDDYGYSGQLQEDPVPSKYKMMTQNDSNGSNNDSNDLKWLKWWLNYRRIKRGWVWCWNGTRSHTQEKGLFWEENNLANDGDICWKWKMMTSAVGKT